MATAEELWETFHRKNPRKRIKVNAPWPQKWVEVGKAETTYYASDKWQEDGDYQRYYHDHDSKTVRCYEPAGTTSGVKEGTKTTAAPVKSFPSEAAVLGYFMGADVRAPSGQLYRSSPEKGTLLCAFPNGKAIFALAEGRVVALFAGRGLSVKSAGICG